MFSQVLSELFRKRPSPQYPASWEVSGIVSHTGSQVTKIKVGDRVAGLLPLDSQTSGCARRCTLQETDVGENKLGLNIYIIHDRT